MRGGKKVIAMSGMPGAGKGVASNAGKQLGLEVFVLGDVIREETEHRGLNPTPKNVGNVMLDIRAKEGPAVVAKRLLPKIEQAKSLTVVVEGVRSLHELNELRSKYEVIALAIHASPKSRYDRLLAQIGVMIRKRGRLFRNETSGSLTSDLDMSSPWPTSFSLTKDQYRNCSQPSKRPSPS